MEKEEFVKLIGSDIIVDYPFFNEVQKWNMKNFYINKNGEIKHKSLNLIIDVFIANARNPHIGEEATHG